MKIASHIKPRNGKPRVVTIHGRPYAFAATEDKLGDTHFVAEVHNEDHAAVLVGSGDFYPYDETLAPKPKLQPTAVATPAKPVTEVLTSIPADVRAEAETLLKGSVATISVGVSKVAPAVVRSALALEQAAATPRKTVVSLLQSTLDGIAAAGVKE